MVVNAAAPISGYCYGPTRRHVDQLRQRQQHLSIVSVESGKAPALPSACQNPLTASTACTYLVAENGQFGAYGHNGPAILISVANRFVPSVRKSFCSTLDCAWTAFPCQGRHEHGEPRAISRTNATIWTTASTRSLPGLPYALTTPFTSGAKCPANPATSNPGIRANWTNTPANFYLPHLATPFCAQRNVHLRR